MNKKRFLILRHTHLNNPIIKRKLKFYNKLNKPCKKKKLKKGKTIELWMEEKEISISNNTSNLRMHIFLDFLMIFGKLSTKTLNKKLLSIQGNIKSDIGIKMENNLIQLFNSLIKIRACLIVIHLLSG